MISPIRPKINLLSPELVTKIIDEAILLLEKVGVMVENEEARSLLALAGAKVNKDNQRVYFPDFLVEESLKKVPKVIYLYDRTGEKAFTLGGDEVHFNPGSAAITILDSETHSLRPAVTSDLVKLSQLTELLSHLDFQSTALVSSDVPQEMADSYRLYIALLFCSKPVVTGTFRVESFEIMKEMLVAMRGSQSLLKDKPLAIFDACPSPPLKWSDLTAQSLIDAARLGQPSELISMGLTGATSPVTITGTLVQHTAENLSGLVITQLAQPGAPVIFGGSPSSFDMREGTTPMGAIETMMIDLASAQIGKALGLPTHAYMGLSDSKIIDCQAGIESASGALLAALAGINVVSGPGMLAFESAQSLEKLLIDDSICGQALRLIEGITQRDEPMALFFFEDQSNWSNFLKHPHTKKWYRKEHKFFPLFDRATYEIWVASGRKDMAERAKEEVKRLLASSEPRFPAPDIAQELRKIMENEAKRYGLKSLPQLV
ncbi:MAG: trimethylamine methyltransferase family protein [Candidatus Aminicenantes bacterium]|nr:trimethylamine methyltransferase family protein [Candidatus Aminicenantes bacterium]